MRAIYPGAKLINSERICWTKTVGWDDEYMNIDGTIHRRLKIH